jgi:hypothetical protein
MLYCEMLSSKYVIVNKLVKSVTIYFMIEDIEQINTKVRCKIKQYRRHHYCHHIILISYVITYVVTLSYVYL